MKANQNVEQFYPFSNNKPVSVPLLGFDVGGWFPFQRFSVLKDVEEDQYIEPQNLHPEACLDDYSAYLLRLQDVADDLVKGVAPIPAIPWIEGMLGCRIKRKGESFWAEERKASYDELKTFDSFSYSPWFHTYIHFVRTLKGAFGAACPVGLPILRGVSDLLGVLRGHEEAILDALEKPEVVKHTALKLAGVIVQLTRAHHRETGLFQGGTFIEQYGLWAPGPVVRMQEDASALYSPELFRACILPADRRIAQEFPYSLLHLHASSLFLVEEFLTVKEIGVFQINRDVGEMGLPEMFPYLKQIQEKGRRLFLRGPFSVEDYRWIKEHLSPIGLIVQTVVPSLEEGKALLEEARRIFQRSGL